MALSIDADLGALDVSLPADIFGGDESCYMDEWGYETCEEEEGPDGQLGFHLGGASASITLSSGDDDSLTVTNIGLGNTTTTATYNGAQIVGVDLNADHGRRLDLMVSVMDEIIEIGVLPALVLEVALDFANAGDLAEDAPPWTMDEDLKASLTGTTPTLSISEDGFKVLSGTLELSATSAETVTVEAGMCLLGGEAEEATPVAIGADTEGAPMPEEERWEEEDDDGDEHPFESLEAGVCE
jgi:hypothetical protein